MDDKVLRLTDCDESEQNYDQIVHDLACGLEFLGILWQYRLYNCNASRSACVSNEKGGYTSYDYSYCNKATFPDFPAGWQVVRTAATDCSLIPDTYWFGVPASTEYVAMATTADPFPYDIVVGVTLKCDTTTGLMSFKYCSTNPASTSCVNWSPVAVGSCVVDDAGFGGASQSTCVAPVATAAPQSSPTSNPALDADSESNKAKSSAVTAVVGSASVLSLASVLLV